MKGKIVGIQFTDTYFQLALFRQFVRCFLVYIYVAIVIVGLQL